jgi:molybdopterin synthase sulfur carrier subunit
MKIQVRYFASLREALGSGETVDAIEGSTVGALRDALIARGAPHAQALARRRAVRTALDQAVCSEATPLHDGAELAFFPPVTGG